MLFADPIDWREPKDHSSDCHFCVTNITAIISKSKHTVKYQDLSSAMRPVHHSGELPVPRSPVNMTTFNNDDSDSDKDHGQEESENVDCDSTFKAICSTSEPHLLTQRGPIDLVRDFTLSK